MTLMTTSKRGMTVIEILITLTITLLLLTSVGPKLNHWMNRVLLDHEIKRFYQLFKQARHSAITSRKNVVICSLDSTQNCHKTLNQSMTIFQDNDHNHRYTSTDTIIQRPTLSEHFASQYPRQRIRFNSSGQAYGYNGTFVICYRKILSRALVISGTGRIRMAHDRNNDGLSENTRGKNFSC